MLHISSVANNLNHTEILNRLHDLADSDHAYWECNNQKVISRPQALQNLSRGQQTRFAFNEKTWAVADWSKPAADLQSQYIQRAKDLRAQHSYVRVAYSGGVDSHTVLTSFRDAGIAPDEIFFWTFLDHDHYRCSTNYELHRSVVEYLPVLQSWFPKAKFTNLNFDLNQLEIIRSLCPINNPFSQYIAGIRNMLSVLCICCMEEFNIENSVTVTGADKPRIDKINHQWYTFLMDTAFDQCWGRTVQGFYLGADPSIHISQSHAMKTLLEQQHFKTRQEIFAFQNSKVPEVRHAINHALARSDPFDNIVVLGKKFTRLLKDPSEGQPKVYLLTRELRKTEQGRQILNSWRQSKDRFTDYTGFDHNISVFGNFYNLCTGKAHNVDQLFSNGWHLD